MSDSQVSIGAALSYAWSLWRTHWRDIWGALALNALACTVLCAGVFAQNLALMGAGFLGLLATKYATYGAMFRLAYGAEHPEEPRFRLGALGLQWRGMELRMFGADLLLGLFVLILTVLLVIALIAPVFAMVISHGPPPANMTLDQLQQIIGPNGMTGVEVGMLLLRAVLVFVMTRLSLYLPATADSGRVAVLRTWKLTRGNFWRIFAAMRSMERLPPWRRGRPSSTA
jgi:hypothetical protein